MNDETTSQRGVTVFGVTLDIEENASINCILRKLGLYDIVEELEKRLKQVRAGTYESEMIAIVIPVTDTKVELIIDTTSYRIYEQLAKDTYCTELENKVLNEVIIKTEVMMNQFRLLH